MTVKLTDIPRNDVDACVRYHDDRGGVTPEDEHVMVMLQDDPRALLAKMRHWKSRGRR